MLDRATFDMTYGDFGNEVIVEIISIYIDEHEDRLKELKKNVDEKDFDSISKNAHSLKGSTASLFDTETAELCRKLEFKGKEEDGNDLEQLYLELKDSVLTLVDELLKMKKSMS